MPAKKHIKYLSSTTQIDSWKYNGMSEENIEIITTSDSNFASNVYEHHLLLDKNFSRLCLINDIFINKKLYIYIYTYIHINIYIYIYIYIYFLHTKPMVKKFILRFYINE